MPEWVLPAVICSIVFYLIPAGICYWAFQVDDSKRKNDITACWFPAFNCLLAVFSIGLIWEHYFPTPENPNDPHAALRQVLEDMQNGTAAKNERRQKYAFDFIKTQQLQKDFDEYCDAMELMRTIENPEAK